MHHEFRWPAFRDDAVAATPIQSMICFDLSTGSQSFGALNLHAERPRSFSDEALDIGRVYAIHIALVWNSLRRIDQFQQALDSRDVIGQAKELVMQRFGIDTDQAFALLRRLSQTTNTPLREVASQLVATHNPNPINTDPD